MSNLCIIPAKGASTRLPRKNILPLAGEPMVNYTVHAALKSAIFDRIVVSTEAQEVAETIWDVIRWRDAIQVMFRPENLAKDPAGVVDVCLHVVESLESHGHVFKTLCILYPSSPLRHAQDIREAFALYNTGRGNSVFSVTEFDHTPYRAVREVDDGTTRFIFPEQSRKKAQELPPAYHITGAIIILSVENLKRHKSYFVSPKLAYILPRSRAVDIDTKDDLLYAEFLMNRRERRNYDSLR